VKNPENSILRGIIDMHIHTNPDLKPRLLDDYEQLWKLKRMVWRPL
jgi:hypothetical protein